MAQTAEARSHLPVPARLFRTGDVTAVFKQPITNENGVVVDSLALEPGQLKAFADSVRSKDGWYKKVVLKSDLLEKWVKEAQLPDDPLVDDLVRDLKSEARCICMLDHTIRVSSLIQPAQAVDWATIQAAVHKADLYLRTSQFGINTPRLYEDVGAYAVDNVVPAVLHKELCRELDALAATEPKDFHPGSGGKVQDLIHPSLYPYMSDTTPLLDGVVHPPTVDGKFVTEMREKHEHSDDVAVMTSAYAWIPTIFSVSADGQSVSADGYINGLGTREQYPTLFKIIEQVFRVVMPALERSAHFHTGKVYAADSTDGFEERRDFLEHGEGTISEWKAMKASHKQAREQEETEAALEEQRIARDREAEKTQYQDESHQPRSSPSRSRWAGQKRKVVVKAANYVLQPGQEYGGTWHIEGMPHERIVASAIYYYERDESIVDAGLYLRRKRDGNIDFPTMENANRNTFGGQVQRIKKGEEGYCSDDDKLFDDYDDDYGYVNTAPSDYGSDAPMGDLPAYMNVGVVPTTNKDGKHGTGRIITFPNWVQHRVVSVYNDPSASETAVRKILCFFLVDDSQDSDEIEYPGFTYLGLEGNKVLTSSDVPQQAQPCNVPTLAFLLPIACRQLTSGRCTLPTELVEIIVSHVRENAGLEFGLSREDAEMRRRALMADRKVQTQNVNGLWETDYSLCEH